MHLGNNHSYKNAQRDMLRAIITEQQEQDEQNKMNEVPQAKAPEEDKNKKFYEMSKKKADEQKKKTATKEAVPKSGCNKISAVGIPTIIKAPIVVINFGGMVVLDKKVATQSGITTLKISLG